MTVLERRLRDALAAEAAQWPDPLAGGLPVRKPRRGWLVAAATATSVLVVAAGVVWVLGMGGAGETELGGDPQVPLAPIAVGAFEQVAGAVGELGVEPASEEPNERGDIIASVEIVAVAAGSQGAVAVGYINGADVGTIWSSPDGASWQRIVHDDALFGDPAQFGNTLIFDVAAGDAGFVAVGGRFTEGWTRLVWSSPDGLSWTRTEVPDLAAAAVVGTDSGWTAVGGDGINSAVWNSDDGLNWVEVESDVFSSDAHDISIRDVAYDGRRLVAVGGSNARDFREERPVIWTSENGIEWERVIDDSGVFDIPLAGEIKRVVAGPNGFVALGQERLAEGDDPGFGAVWFSSDGLQWERTRLSDTQTGLPGWATAGSAGYVLSGFRWDEDGPVTQLWTSTDGKLWSHIEPEGVPSHYPGTLSMIDRRLLIFGAQQRDTGHPLDPSGFGAGAVWAADL